MMQGWIFTTVCVVSILTLVRLTSYIFHTDTVAESGVA